MNFLKEEILLVKNLIKIYKCLTKNILLMDEIVNKIEKEKFLVSEVKERLFQKLLDENYEIKKELFNLPDYTLPIAMLTLGYYPEDLKRTKSNRFDKQYIVFEEEYRRLESTELKDMHKEKEDKIKEIVEFFK